MTNRVTELFLGSACFLYTAWAMGTVWLQKKRTKNEELEHFRKLARSDPYQYIAGNCCGDAHMVLETALEQLRVLGFEIETRETEHFTEHVWHNRRAELAEARNEALLQALKDIHSQARNTVIPASLILSRIRLRLLKIEVLDSGSASQEAKTPGT